MDMTGAPSDFDAEKYLQCLVAVAKADGLTTGAEKEFIENQADFFSIDPAPLWECEPDSIINGLGELSRATKMLILRDCILLGCIDGVFDESERDRILYLTRAMGIREADFIALESWISEYNAVMAKGKRLLSDD